MVQREPAVRSKGLAELQAGDHVCFLYKTEEEHRAFLVEYLSGGIQRGEKVLYVLDSHTAAVLVDYLHGRVNLTLAIAKGQLRWMQAADAYTPRGRFEPNRVLELWRKEIEEAREEGFPALRATGEMGWARADVPGAERLVEYESRANDTLPKMPVVALCQYPTGLFSTETLRAIRQAHPWVVYGGTVRENPEYLPLSRN